MKTGKLIEFHSLYILLLIVVTRFLLAKADIQDLIVCGVIGNADNRSYLVELGSVEKRAVLVNVVEVVIEC